MSYEELKDMEGSGNMAARLAGGRDNSAWSWVTTQDAGGSVTGKYSFGARADLLGKDYPFPTVITQPDLSYGGNVNVHYGAWPVDGPYWDEGFATIDLFSDMTETAGGWQPEKLFTLNDPDHRLSELTAADFVCAPDGIAEVVECAPNGDSAISIRVRALRDGSCVISALKKTDDQSFRASFVLSVTARIACESEPVTLSNYLDGVSELTTRAHPALSDTVPPVMQAGVWQLTPNDMMNWEEESAPGADQTWTVTHMASGTGSLEARFTCTWRERSYSATMYVPVTTYGLLGLSGNGALTADGTPLYTEARRGLASTVAGETAAYEPETGPALPEAAEWGDFFLYTGTEDTEFADVAVERITVTADGVQWSFLPVSGGFTPEQEGCPFRVTVYDSVYTDGTWQYRKGRIRYTGSGSGPEAALSLELTHALDTFKIDGMPTQTRYRLTLSGLRIPKRVAIYDSADGRTIYYPVWDDTLILAENTFSRTGYIFCGWILPKAGSELRQPGKEYTIPDGTGDVFLSASWRAANYTLAFHPNGGGGSMDAMTMVYDTAVALPESGFTPPASDRKFAGWGTAPQGGTIYAVGDQVKNLTAEDGGTVTFYALWRNEISLILHYDNYDPVTFPVIPGITESLSNYERPAGTASAPVLDGWYTGTDGSGDRVVDRDGRLTDVSLTSDLDLYPYWRLPVLRLVHNGRTETISDTSASTFAVPTETLEQEGYDNWAIDGWFSESSGDGGEMILNAAGKVVWHTSYDDNAGVLTLADDLTLYARWSRALQIQYAGATEAEPLEEPFSPKKRSWLLTEPVTVDWDAGEFIELTVDLKNTSSDNGNIVSFGKNGEIGSLTDKSKTHLFIQLLNSFKQSAASNQKLGIHALYGTDTEINKAFWPHDTLLVLRLGKNGLWINGDDCSSLFPEQFRNLMDGGGSSGQIGLTQMEELMIGNVGLKNNSARPSDGENYTLRISNGTYIFG